MSNSGGNIGCTFFGLLALIFILISLPDSDSGSTSSKDYRPTPSRLYQSSSTSYSTSSNHIDTPIATVPRVSYQEYRESVRSSSSFTPDDAYDEGYEEGYQQGYEDGLYASYESGYDDSNSYYDYYEECYIRGYQDGYDDGYYSGLSDRDEDEDEDDEDYDY